MQLVSKFDLMTVEFGKWNQSTITTLDFKNHLINTYPDYRWTQKDCSDFLASQGLAYTVLTNKDNQQYRVYNVNPSTNLYYSESRGEFLEIDEMNIVHLENAINKSFGDLTVAELLDEADSQEWYMLRTFLNKKYDTYIKNTADLELIESVKTIKVENPNNVHEDSFIITNLNVEDIPVELKDFLQKIMQANK